MKRIVAVLGVLALVWGLSAAPASAQDKGDKKGDKRDEAKACKEKGEKEKGENEGKKPDKGAEKTESDKPKKCGCSCGKDGKKDEGDDADRKPENRDKRPCGRTPEEIKRFIMKCHDWNEEDLEREIREHFKKHPDGRCHCLCDHETRRHEAGEGRPEGGRDGKKCDGDHDGKPRAERPDGDKHEGKRPADGERRHKCDCDCHKHRDGDGARKGDGDRDSGDKRGGDDGGSKGQDRRHGNNGVGNGQDPQPPGNPPQNDGPGTGPGHPGNRGGAHRGGHR